MHMRVRERAGANACDKVEDEGIANRAAMSVLAVRSLLITAPLSPVFDVRLLRRFHAHPRSAVTFARHLALEKTRCEVGIDRCSTIRGSNMRGRAYHIDQHLFQIPEKLFGRNVRQPAARSGRRGEDEWRESSRSKGRRK